MLMLVFLSISSKKMLVVLFVFFFFMKLGGVFLEMKLMSSVYFSLKLVNFWSQKFFFSLFFFISTSAVFYSIYYMKFSNYVNRFLIVKLLFVFSMLLLIFSKNLILIFLGWDGLGVSSFSLIIFYLNSKSFNSGAVTIFMNRVGDGIFLVFIMLMLMISSLMKVNLISYFLLLMLFIIFLTKSAQFPFSTWLPLAMAAPTPISALVHSSTLVAAGIYLFLDNYILVKSVLFTKFMIIFCLMTFFISGAMSFIETDFKKIIALSTLNQLSLMFITLSLGLVLMSFFHLLTHAIFKSLLFFNGGVFLHFFFSAQDYRVMGFSSVFFNWLLTISFFISLLNLMGLVYSCGFFSKDLIVLYIDSMLAFSFFSFFFIMSLNFTFFYCYRLVKMAFFSSSGVKLSFMMEEISVFFPLIFLSVLSLFLGFALMAFIFSFSINFNCMKFIVVNFFLSLFLLSYSYILMNNFKFKLIGSGSVLNKFIGWFSFLIYKKKMVNFLFEIGWSLSMILKLGFYMKNLIQYSSIFFLKNFFVIMCLSLFFFLI